VRLDLHIHSEFSSDSTIPVELIVRRVKRAGLDGFAVTDHNAVGGTRKALELARDHGLVAIPGTEVSASEGHVLAFGIREAVPRDLPAEETVERIHDLGGVAVAAHPFRIWSGIGGKTLREVGFDAVEVVNGRTAESANREARRVARGRPAVAGSDSHRGDRIGRCATVLSMDGDVDDVLEHIRRGKAVAEGKGRTLAETPRYATKTVGEWIVRGFGRM
jgi:predicted metal-dependent phosphoesterase TrpH